MVYLLILSTVSYIHPFPLPFWVHQITYLGFSKQQKQIHIILVAPTWIYSFLITFTMRIYRNISHWGRVSTGVSPNCQRCSIYSATLWLIAALSQWQVWNGFKLAFWWHRSWTTTSSFVRMCRPWFISKVFCIHFSLDSNPCWLLSLSLFPILIQIECHSRFFGFCTGNAGQEESETVELTN